MSKLIPYQLLPLSDWELLGRSSFQFGVVPGFGATILYSDVLYQTLGKIATWLILPVVIRSSQRLSHACLSINLLL
jgi:hypothetical protein